MALTDKLTAIANAIRAKTGKTAKMTMTEMATEITNIPQASTVSENAIIERTISGEYSNDSVTVIGKRAFDGCSSLTSVSFPAATGIGENAFNGCSSLAAVDIPNAANISYNAFYDCKALKTVNFAKAVSIGAYSFYACKNLVLADFALLTSIGGNAFADCTKLATLILRNTTAVCSLNSSYTTMNSTAIDSGAGYIYVPDSLVDSYKANTYWKSYAAQIKPLSEYTGG